LFDEVVELVMVNWTCEQTELRLSDYLDGVLGPGEKHAFDKHVSGCERCTPLVASVSHLLTNLHGMEEIPTPPRLVYAILDKTLGPREAATGWSGVLGWFRGVISPRLLYGSISVAATVMVLLSASGFSWRKPKIADLSPVNVYRNADRQAHLVYARGSKFVSDLRVVYEIQARFRQDSDLPTTPESTMPEATPGKQPGSTDSTKPASPKQQNRANGIGHELQVLAMELPVLSVRSMR
jgi:anti-sigma factor RsiW